MKNLINMRNIFSSFIYLFLICFPLSAQNQSALPATQSENFWISAGAQAALYSPVSLSAGGNLTVAYGSRTSIGVNASWLYDHDGQLNIVVLDFLLRVFLFGSSANSGLFFQFAGGPALFFESDEDFSLPVRIGTLSAGLAIGWRFLFGKYFYIEPSVGGGYPYIFGAGMAAGVRF